MREGEDYGNITWQRIWTAWFRNLRSDLAWMIICALYQTSNRDEIRTKYLCILAWRKLQHKHLSFSEHVIAFLGSMTVVGGPVLGPNTILVNAEYRRRMIENFCLRESNYRAETFNNTTSTELEDTQGGLANNQMRICFVSVKQWGDIWLKTPPPQRMQVEPLTTTCSFQPQYNTLFIVGKPEDFLAKVEDIVPADWLFTKEESQ